MQHSLNKKKNTIKEAEQLIKKSQKQFERNNHIMIN